MTQSSDIADLADRFLRLWEESWQQIAQDPDIARYWSNLFAAMQRSAFMPPFGPPPVATGGASPYPYEHGQAGMQTDRPAPAAAAPVDGGERVDELARRIRDLEQSLAELTDRLDRAAGGDRGKRPKG